jgi:hypothetical protein
VVTVPAVRSRTARISSTLSGTGHDTGGIGQTSAKVEWIGRRTVDCARHPRPETVWPVRVKAGAFGKTVPRRDLVLSPDHAVFVDGVLIPVKYLINGASIARIRRRTVTYYHLELPDHAIILAESLPVESYLDLGDRANFAGETVARLVPDFTGRLTPDTALIWESRGAAPLVVTGPRLEAARKRLARRIRAQRSPAPSRRRAG